MTTIALVRHGLVENPGELYYGRLPSFALADLGRRQAAAAARHLARNPVTAIYHSPMLRACQTAEIIGAGMVATVPVVECALLNEIHSPYDGQTWAEMERRNWDFYGDVVPPYEQPQDILARVHTFFARAREEHPGQHIVGVSHGDPIAFAILWASGRPATVAQKRQLIECGVYTGYPAPASISTFRFDEAGALLHYNYHCPHDMT